jgi:hypothetical protein
MRAVRIASEGLGTAALFGCAAAFSQRGHNAQKKATRVGHALLLARCGNRRPHTERALC